MVMVLPCRIAACQRCYSYGRLSAGGAVFLRSSMSQQPRPTQGDDEQGGGSSSDSETSRSWLQLGLGPSSSTSLPAAAATSAEATSASLVLQPQVGASPSTSSAATGGLAVTAPPPRPAAGFWFVLRPAQDQQTTTRGPPPLPALPRSYLRIRDGRMAISTVMRYVGRKLGLEDEAQVEITCRGQPLHPAALLQHVRDAIWRRPAGASPPAAAADQPLMLHYRRRS